MSNENQVDNSPYVGVDPGTQAGCIAIITNGIIETHKLPRDYSRIKQLVPEGCIAAIEDIPVNQPTSAVAAKALFLCQGYSVAACSDRGDYALVNPAKWQLKVAGRDIPRGRENYDARKTYLWEVAKTLYPNQQIYKYAADAVLLAHYSKLEHQK